MGGRRGNRCCTTLVTIPGTFGYYRTTLVMKGRETASWVSMACLLPLTPDVAR